MTGRREARTTSLRDSASGDGPFGDVDDAVGDGMARARDAPDGEQGQHDDHAGERRGAQQRDRRSRLGRRIERLLQTARLRRRWHRRRVSPDSSSMSRVVRRITPFPATVISEPPSNDCESTGPVIPSSISRSMTRLAPSARSTGSRPSTRARSVTMGRLKNAKMVGCADGSEWMADKHRGPRSRAASPAFERRREARPTRAARHIARSAPGRQRRITAPAFSRPPERTFAWPTSPRRRRHVSSIGPAASPSAGRPS